MPPTEGLIVRAPGGGPEALRTPSLAHKLKGGDRMEPQQARKAADTARSGQIGPKRPFPPIFQKWRQARIVWRNQVPGKNKNKNTSDYPPPRPGAAGA